jgi:hydrogenase maturation protease
MPGLVVIGWGNPLRGDDAFGFLAAERLAPLLPDAKVLAVQQLTPELMDAVAHAERVIFIDASAEGPSGILRKEQVVPSNAAEAFTHHATPAGLLAGAKALYGSSPGAVLYSVRAETLEFGQPLSGGVVKALEEVVEAVVLQSKSLDNHPEASDKISRR